jgi:oligopeptide/dipeptide ABC transporter ATP-binding protein
MDAPPILDVHELQVAFVSRDGLLCAVDGVSLRVGRGRTVALVGESGCGKSATALAILRLIPASRTAIEGQVLFDDPNAPPSTGNATDLLRLNDESMRRIRGNRIAMIFQEPMTALNPVYTVGEQIVEVIELHRGFKRREAWHAAEEMLKRVRIADAGRRMHDYPHQLSGGMRQRAMIAMALACRPALLLADEPTTALDPTVQREILHLLGELRAELDMSVLLITHDLGVVAEAAEDVYVMYAGRIVEYGPVGHVLQHPLHPYTQGLLRCTPRLGRSPDVHRHRGLALPSRHGMRLPTIPGTVPDPTSPPGGCRFHPRCAVTADRATGNGRTTLAVKSEIGPAVLRRCVEEFEGEPSGRPLLREHEPGHFVACWEAG